MIDHDRRIDEGIIATGRFPVDQPELLTIEQDVARGGVVVAGNQPGRACIVGFAEQFKALHMRIEQAGRKQTGPPHMREQARDDVGIVDVIREHRGGLHPRKHLSQRLRKRARPARIGVQRLFLHEVDHHDTGRLVDIVDRRSNSRLRRDAHRDILVRIAQRTWFSLHPQQIAPAAGLETKGRCGRNSAGNRGDRADGIGAKGRDERRAHIFALLGGERIETMFAHDQFPN